MTEHNSLKLYVAPDGSDKNDGESPCLQDGSGPLATLDRAFEVLRLRKLNGAVAGPVEIYLRGGVYAVEKPIVVKPCHSMPVTVLPYKDEQPVISGGRELTGWEETTHAGVRAWTLTLDEVKDGHWYFRSLFVNNDRRERPRLPKKTRTRIAEVPGLALPNDWFGPGSNQFKLPAGEMKAFKNLSDIDVMAFHFWICERLPIASFDASSELITTKVKSRVALVESWGVDLAPCYLDNVYDALDTPGEWYLSRSDGRLIYLPYEDETLENCKVVAPKALQLLKLVGDPGSQATVEWITFKDIEFRHTDWAQPNEAHVDKDTAWHDPTRSVYRQGRMDTGSATQADCDISGAIFLKGARNCNFVGCTIANVGWYGVELGDGCRSVALRGCEIADLGGGGVKLNGACYDDHTPLLENGNNQITDCHIHHGGRVFCAATGIHCMHSFGNRFSHNDIHDLYYTGISIGWQWNFKPSICRDNGVEYNHIHHLGSGMLSDMGGVYTLGIQSGTVIRNNHIHDIEAATYGAWCIYPDEGSSHLLIENNVCHSTNREIFHQHYGRENIVRNNLFAFAGDGVVTYSCFVKPDLGFRMYKNILLARSEPHFLGGYEIKLDTMGHESNFNLLYRYDGETPRFATKANTTAAADGAVDFDAWQALGHDRQSIVADPLCADPEQGDFTLDRASPAIQALGFEPINLSAVGPRSRDLWHDYEAPHHRAKR